MTHNNLALLASIRFESGQDIDGLLEDIVFAQIAAGAKVHGVLQSRGRSKGECHCADMDLRTIGTDQVFRISQPLGSGSVGCRLDPGALAECSAYLQRQISDGCDLLVLNRFGKGESEGQGFRELISVAMASGISVLTSMRSIYVTPFEAFAEELGVVLPFDKVAVDCWLMGGNRLVSLNEFYQKRF